MNKDIYYLVGPNIKKQRKLKGITQLELANKTFYLDTVSKIALSLDIDIRLLFEPLNNETIT